MVSLKTPSFGQNKSGKNQISEDRDSYKLYIKIMCSIPNMKEKQRSQTYSKVNPLTPGVH